MAGVEQPQLHQLIRFHVGHDLHAGLLQRRAAVGEVVFEHPLRERLAEHGPLVVDAEPAAELGPIGVGRHRRDAVDHAVREADVAGHPVGQRRIAQPGERGERALAHVPVALDVVAGQHAEGGNAPVAAARQRLGHQPENGARQRSRAQVSHDRRIGGIELTGDGVEVVAAFCDGERHDPGRRRGHLLDRGLGVIGGEQVLDDRPDHAGLPGAVAVPQDQGIQAILGGQHVAHPSVGRLQADAADTPVHRRTAIHQRVDVHRLVRAVKVPDADVHDSGRDVAAIVTRHWATSAFSRRQGFLGQAGHAVPSLAPAGSPARSADVWVVLRAVTICRNLA